MPPTSMPERRRPRLLLVVPAGSYRIGDHLTAATDLGCDVVVATDAAVAIPGAAIVADFADARRAAGDILAALDATPDGVVATDGRAIDVAGHIAHRLGHPANTPAALRSAADKARQRRAVATAGIPQPDFTVDRPGGASPPGRSWPLPAVVKPVDRTASQGVMLARTGDEVAAALRRVRRLVGPTAPVLVEEFVPGVEVAVDVLLRAGRMHVLAMFDKPDTPAGPTFPETLLIRPARLPDATRHTVLDVVARALRAIGVTEGPVHAEVIVSGDRVWFLEMAARSIGGLCSRTIRPGGQRLEEVVIRHALGMPVATADPTRATGVVMLPVPTAGRLRAVEGIDEALAVDGVTDLVLTVGPGHHVTPLPDGDHYLGFVFAEADSPHTCERALRAAWAHLDARIEPAVALSASSAGRTGRRRPHGR